MKRKKPNLTKGSYLKDGLRRRKCLLDISEWLGNPKGTDLKATNFTAYLSYKTESGISEKTINNHLGYMNAVYNYLSDVGESESFGRKGGSYGSV